MLRRVSPSAFVIGALLLAASCGSGDIGGNSGDGDGGGGSRPDAPAGGDDEPPALAGITAAHNAVRATVGVGPMVWNADLAATAQAWADACVDNDAPAGLIDHNDGRSDGHPWYVGENIYGSSGPADPQDAVDAWASEGQYYDYASNTCAAGQICGHYTQVVWAESTNLGCGISSCAGLTFGNSIVCDYGPGGNDGGRPY
jgi:uncharacterized protein YkwD